MGVLYSRRKSILNIIGDSHANTYAECENTTVCVVHHDLSIQNLRTYYTPFLKAIDSKKNEPWLLVIGERDCRKNIFVDSIEQKSTVDEVLEDYISKLTKFLYLLNSNYTIYASSVSPTGDFADTISEYRAPREIRQIITAKYNARLKIECNKMGLPYLEIWKLGAHSKDMVPKGYFEADWCHIQVKMASNQLANCLKIL